MSILVEFFIAPDDDTAATVVEGGPEDHFPAVTDYGNFLVFQALAEWESLFTGRSLDDLVSAGEPRAVTDDESGSAIYAASPTLQRALTTADPAVLAEIGTRWKQDTTSTGAPFDPEMIDALLSDVAELARTATGQNHSLYCWMC
ncbi:hypothetical protein ABIA39_004670 [Nocardia sp. GAS34]|uniref:hypothetical protein n=1 Tax=unclassified Nocardia TaxID=2637762 RepID=UPI003D21B848